MSDIKPLIMTDWIYVGVRDGKCIALSLRSQDQAENESLLERWKDMGIEARLVHRDEMRWWHDKFDADRQTDYREWRRRHPLRWLYYKLFGWPDVAGVSVMNRET